MGYFRTINSIAESVTYARSQNAKVVLLIGAGCSVTAGIPAANWFKEEIQRIKPSEYEALPEKTYSRCMELLEGDEQQEIIGNKVKEAKINWAHLVIAQLMKHGYVDRVLTTNFDPLVLRACAMKNVFPGIYDMTMFSGYKPSLVSEKSVFHLHGQYTGFKRLNTKKDLAKPSRSIGKLLNDSNIKRVWVVVGYSGKVDHIFDELAKIKNFGRGLYWVGQEAEPPEHLREKLLNQNKSAYYVQHDDADRFFVELAQKLSQNDQKLFPHKWLLKPFSYVSELLENIAPYHLQGNFEISLGTKKFIDTAIQSIESGESGKHLKTQYDLFAGHYEQVTQENLDGASEERKHLVGIAWAALADGLAQKALLKQGEEADKLFIKAYQKYKQAVSLKPDFHEALYNWGNVLSNWAKTKQGKKADRLYKRSCQKHEQAVALKPDFHEALNNWAIALSERAITKQGEEANELYKKAREKYEQAVAIEPNHQNTFYNWASTLSDWARTKQGEEAGSLFEEACQKQSL